MIRLLACALALAMPAGAASAMDNAIHSRHFTTSDGVKLHVLEACPPGLSVDTASSVIAFVPGWSMPAAVWREQLRALGATHCVAALDPRGQGESEIASDGYNIGRRAIDVQQFLMRYRRVVLVGWSLGALEVLECIHRHGLATVDGLVLVDSSVGEEPAPVAGPGPGLREKLQADRAATLNEFVRDMFAATRDDAEIEALIESALRMPLEASLSLFPSAVPRTHWRDIAWTFPQPLLYAVSAQFAEQARSLQKNRPATRIEIFENAGHALFADEAARFNALLAQFVDAAIALKNR